MNISIRNISKQTIVKINEMASARGESRNEFLKKQLELIAIAPAIMQKEDSYEKLINILLKKLGDNDKVLCEVRELLSERKGGKN